MRFWDEVVKSEMFFCPVGPAPSTITNPFDFGLSIEGSLAVSVRPVVGTSIVPNGRFSPVANHGVGPESRTVDRLTGSPAAALVCIDGTELGVRTWGDYRTGYLGEYADPMYRHGSTEKCIENMDMGYSAVTFAGDPSEMPRGTGKANVSFLDGHVELLDEDTVRTRWDSGQINYRLE